MTKRVLVKKTKPKAGKDSFGGKASFIMKKQYAAEMYQTKQSIKGRFLFCVYCILHQYDNWSLH